MKRSNLLGFIVGILLGILFSLPFVLGYVFLNLFFGYLAILIIFGLILGYKLINKKIYNTGGIRFYLIISSILIVFLDVFVLAPIIVQIKTLNSFGFEFINLVFSTKSLLFAFFMDSIPALLVTLIPALVIPIDFRKSESEPTEGEVFLNRVEEIFTKHNALSKESAIAKNVIKEEVEKIDMNGFKRFLYLDCLKTPRIKSKSGKWYFNKKDKPFKFGLYISILLLIISTTVWNISTTSFREEIKEKTVASINEELYGKKEEKNIEYNINDKLSITMPSNMKYFEEKHDDLKEYSVDYYQYVTSNIINSNLEAMQIYYYNNYDIYSYFDNYESLKNNMRDLFKDYEIDKEDTILVNGFKGFYFRLLNSPDSRITIVYFIPMNNSAIEIYTYLKRESFNNSVQENINNIIRTIKVS